MWSQIASQLYFDFVKVIFRLTAEVKVILSTTCPQGKYHCRRQYHCESNITPKAYHCRAAHTALLKSHCRGRQCSLLCLCAPFPHGYTVSRGVPDNCTFEIALSGAAMLTLMLVCAFLHVVCFILDQTIVASDKCLSYARMLLFPTGT